MSSKHEILNALKLSALTNHPMPSIDVAPRVEDLVGQFETNLKTVAGTLHREGGLAALQAKVDELVAQGLQVISLVEGITAENGAIWVNNKNLGHRVTPFICENLILALPANKIVPNMHQAAKEITLASGEFGVFIAGPSKTADIEQALVVGAHGACSSNVYLL